MRTVSTRVHARRADVRHGESRPVGESESAAGSLSQLPALDGVRGLAVLIVIIHNSAWIAGSSHQFIVKLLVAVTASGWIGVSLFFALSGLLITGILLDTRGRADFFHAFYVRRTLRIFPLYYAFLIGVVFVAAPLAWSPAWAAEVRAGQWPYWFYMSNWTQTNDAGVPGMTHLWSLAVEEQFYLIWPLLAYILGRRGISTLAIAMIVTGPSLRWMLLASGLPNDSTYLFTFARWDALAAGALLAASMRDTRARRLVVAWRGALTIVLTCALVVLVLIQHGFHSDDVPVALIGQSLIVGLSFCLLAYALDSHTISTRHLQWVLGRRWLRTVGKYSYAMYMLHFPIHHALKIPLGPWVTATDDSLRVVRVLGYLLLVLVLSFGAALLSWRIIEAPFLRLRDKWAPRAGGAVLNSTGSRAAAPTH